MKMKLLTIILKREVFYGTGLLLAGLILGWLLFAGGSNGNRNETESAMIEMEKHDHEEGSIWTCSMHPQIRGDGPGQCPICGLELVPISTNVDEDVGPTTILMSENAMKIAEVETSVVEKKVPFKEVYFPGKVKADERRISKLTSRYPGRIEKLSINFTGQKVRKGQVLATIYSPELVTAQKELFEARKYKSSNPQFYRAAKNKLKLWDLTDGQIEKIENSVEVQFYFEILSPLTGTVTMRHVTLGDYVKEGSPLFEIVNFSRVWVMFDAYQSNIPWVRLGDKIRFSIKSIPGREFVSTVTFVDPVINPNTRVAYVRTEMSNPGEILKPGMFTSGILKSRLSGNKESIVIPKSAILWTGKKAVVYVKNPSSARNMFSYREIVLGEDAGNHYVVKEGLEEGELVATNGVFKIDAAAQLQGKTSMMNPDGGKVSMAPDHGSMESENKKEPEEIDPKFKIQLQEVFEQYLTLVDALIESNAEKASSSATNIKTTLDKVDMSLLKGDAHMKWMEHLGIMDKSLKGIKGTKDIKVQRTAFSMLSEAFYQSIKHFDITGLNAFYQFCPMANDSKGAFWLSRSEEILNPYYGEYMISCGETKEELK